MVISLGFSTILIKFPFPTQEAPTVGIVSQLLFQAEGVFWPGAREVWMDGVCICAWVTLGRHHLGSYAAVIV